MVTAEAKTKFEHCPALTAVRVISGKWKTRLLWALRSGPQHFNLLRRTLKGISQKMLIEHLRQLEADGIVHREASSISGVAYATYAYTEYGRTLIPILDTLGEWGVVHETLRAPGESAEPVSDGA